MAAKKVTTHMTCNKQVDGSGYEHVKDLGCEPRMGAATDLRSGPGCLSAFGEGFHIS